MLLAIDVGNTNVTIGVFDGERLAHSWRLAALRERTADELGIFVTRLFEQMHVPSRVGPRHRRRLGRAAADAADGGDVRALLLAARRWSSTRPTPGMPVHYTPAGDVGADRIVNAVAAWDEVRAAPAAVPLIVVDFGTGTTFDVISTAGEYLGGVICPGINISAEALFQRAARLPRVDVRKPAQVIGQNTVNAMQSGLFFGYVEMVDGLVRRIRAELERRRHGGRHRDRRARRRHLRRERRHPARRRRIYARRAAPDLGAHVESAS